MIQNIPFELKQLRQWVVATGVPTPQDPKGKQPINPNTGFAASVVDPNTWGTFEQALAAGYKHIGFVLSKDDPYTIIDLDDPRKNSKGEEEINTDVKTLRAQTHNKILNRFQSYAETSQSGNGMHIIVKGVIPRGCRRDKVEVYSDSRYMICTGNVYNNRSEITNQQDQLDKLFKEMLPVGREKIELVQIDSDISDEDVLRMARNADNAENFNYLWNSSFVPSAKYESQSEADFALISMLCFYTVDNAQVRRLFRQSALGQREKATRNDVYIDYALEKFRREEAEKAAAMGKVDISGLMLKAKICEQQLKVECEEQEQTIIAQAETNSENFYPPGFVGELAKYFYANSFQPLPEASLTAALGLCSGVLGRQFQTSTAFGLSLYMCLIAETSYGKEATRKNIFNTLNKLALADANFNVAQKANKFIAKEFASSPAITTMLHQQSPCIVGVLDEFGKFMRDSTGRQETVKNGIRTVMLSLHGLNSMENMFAGTAYSNKEKNIEPITCPALSVVALTTPNTLYDVLNEDMISDGFLPRFIILEYIGPRPLENEHREEMNPRMFAHLKNITDQVFNLEQKRQFVTIPNSEEANLKLREFVNVCRTKTGIANELYSRAALNARKLAALLAAADNPYNPVVNLDHAKWATTFVQNCVEHIFKKFETQSIGVGNGRQESDLIRVIKDYLSMNIGQRLAYSVKMSIAQASLVPFSFLRRRAQRLNSFREDKRGIEMALDYLLRALLKAEILQQMPEGDMMRLYKTTMPLYTLGQNWQVCNIDVEVPLLY